MGKVLTVSGDTPGALAQKYLGNWNLWPELWSGDPHRMPTGIWLSYPEGPAKQPPVGAPPPSGPPGPLGTTTLTPGQNQEFANLNGYSQSQLESEVNTFLSYLGYPTNVHASALAYYLWKSGLVNQPYSAYQYLLSIIPSDMAKANPWAGYGIDETVYHELVQRFASQWLDVTGQRSIPPEVLDKAIRGSWTETQMQQFALQSADLNLQQPWLAMGQTFRQAEESYSTMYGKLPADTQTLATWFNFRQTVQHVGGQAPAVHQLSQQAQQRQRDVVVR